MQVKIKGDYKQDITSGSFVSLVVYQAQQSNYWLDTKLNLSAKTITIVESSKTKTKCWRKRRTLIGYIEISQTLQFYNVSSNVSAIVNFYSVPYPFVYHNL